MNGSLWVALSSPVFVFEKAFGGVPNLGSPKKKRQLPPVWSHFSPASQLKLSLAAFPTEPIWRPGRAPMPEALGDGPWKIPNLALRHLRSSTRLQHYSRTWTRRPCYQATQLQQRQTLHENQSARPAKECCRNPMCGTLIEHDRSNY